MQCQVIAFIYDNLVKELGVHSMNNTLNLKKTVTDLRKSN